MERNDFINIGICLIGIFVGLSSCSKKDSVDKEFLKENVAFISEQLDLQLQEIEKTGEFLYPRSIKNRKCLLHANTRLVCRLFPF